MSTISQYTFTTTFNADKITTRQASEMDVQSYLITSADTDNDGELSFEEIIANTELCDKILEQVNQAKTTVPNATKEPQQVNNSESNVSYEA